MEKDRVKKNNFVTTEEKSNSHLIIYLQALFKFLKGKKTSIATILAAILILLQGHGIITYADAQIYSIILVALGLGANITEPIVNQRINKKSC